ncbi:uncharacterized protein LOC122025735 [Zingiber officinale]|uniref:uncharacterized protein LOC122025735 n=1 Tax=Zingiber officinale TaxID=94328 RepID=UPI001C4DD4FA|nr:uncharacterized protein LOC122025735 [Zingiber officinale]
MAETKGSLVASEPLDAPDEVDQLEAGRLSQILCRVCLRSDGRDLISPCKCEGSSKFVHRECLNYHRAVKERYAFANCTDCKAPYYLRIHIHPERKGRILQFLKFRNILCLFAMIQITICLLASIGYLVCGTQTYFGRFSYSHGRTFYDYFYYWWPLGRVYATEFNVYYGLVVLLCCLLLGFSGFFMACYNLGILKRNPQSYQDNISWSECIKAFYYGSMAEVDRAWLELMFIMEFFVIVIIPFMSILYAITIASVFGRQIWKHHFYTRGKQLLMREYVVEDVDGLVKDWCPPPLPPAHVKELAGLGFL